MALTTSIFGLAALLISYQIYNVNKRIQENILNNLLYFWCMDGWLYLVMILKKMMIMMLRTLQKINLENKGINIKANKSLHTSFQKLNYYSPCVVKF